ncbi:MAG TPA: nucleotide disphospho-sugar-binding domain-containing protein [Solirubrobacterales bacterium]|nr:nucleotide disphospho-sugar-binding domain-containing protein [Solirubrobacterales bacterium]
MSRILAYTSPARGHLFPLTPILLELRKRDHEVALRTLSSEVAAMGERGLEVAPIDPAIEAIEHEDWRERSPRAALRRAVETFCARAAHDAPDLRRAIEQERPDALLVDIQSWGALATAEAWGGPWAAFCPYPLPLPSRDAPPFGPGLPPALGPLGRLRDRTLRPLVLGTVERVLVGQLNEVRAGLGLGPVDATTMFTRPPLLLYMTAEPFEYPRSDWPPNVRLVGPCAWDPPAARPDWLAEVRRPLVLVTTSSEFQDDGRLVRTALAALAREPVEVVATLPAVQGIGEDVPANARVLPFVPHGPLLERAACAITHGGMGATQKAIAHGVPVCAVPFGRDQLEVARRLEVCGAGSRLPASRLTPDRLRDKVREAMDRREGAERIAAAFAATGGPAAAAEAVLELVDAGPRDAGPGRDP